MTKRLFPVLGPTTQRYSADFQTDHSYSAVWAGLLTRWHAEGGVVRCLCRPTRSVPLVLRRYSSGKVDLVRHPHTGPDHDGECRYYGPSIHGTIAQAYERGVVEEDDGVYKIRLVAGRTMQEASEPTHPVEPRVRMGPGVPRQRAMTALGLLKLLWEIAALHEYRPAWAAARANAASVAGRLLEAANSVRWGTAALTDNLQVGPAPRNGQLAKHNRRVAAAAVKRRTRMVIVGRLKSYSDGTQESPIDLAAGVQVPLAGWDIARPFLRDEHARGLQRSFHRELAAWRAGGTIHAILIVQPRPEGTYFDLLQIALMRVSPRAIPLDSGYEADVEEMLAAQSRCYDKPMRYVEGDDTLPDFRLLDTGAHPLVMEVFGRNDPDYQARMNEKMAQYNREFTVEGWWHWNAFAADPLPPFPPAANAAM